MFLLFFGGVKICVKIIFFIFFFFSQKRPFKTQKFLGFFPFCVFFFSHLLLNCFFFLFPFERPFLRNPFPQKPIPFLHPPLSHYPLSHNNNNKKMSKEEEPNKEEGCLTLKRTVINRFEYKRLVLRELDGIENCHSAPILESFPLIGITSMIASQYIIGFLFCFFVFSLLSSFD